MRKIQHVVIPATPGFADLNMDIDSGEIFANPIVAWVVMFSVDEDAHEAGGPYPKEMCAYPVLAGGTEQAGAITRMPDGSINYIDMFFKNEAELLEHLRQPK